MRALVEALRSRMAAAGHPEHRTPQPGTRVVLYVADHDRPRGFRRRAAATFVVSLVESPTAPLDLLRSGYPFLVRTLGNLCIYATPDGDGLRPNVITLERGAYPVRGRDRAASLDALYGHIAPLALSRLVIENQFAPSLPRELWDGDEHTREIGRAGERLEALGLLPAPFPLDELLSPREQRHVRLLYGVTGLSYGNVSARHDARRFWMSASGVAKSRLRRIGREILLVEGFDASRGAVRVSVPPWMDRPARASVDAIEHWMIYSQHPQVGAIVHVHAWMDGVAATEINYPCGTLELAQSVADIVAASPEPMRAVVGQKNHGLTITGPTLDDIFGRIEGRLRTQLPMAA
jgi:ribulose-5-phosphate 4-epimerase/fuculose-1-phosphate aldolase